MSDYSEHLISMAGGDGDELDAIQLRADRTHKGWDLETNAQVIADRDTLLALVREQRGQIDRVEKVALNLHDPRVIQYSFHIGSDPEHDAYKAQVAARIRAALEPTP